MQGELVYFDYKGLDKTDEKFLRERAGVIQNMCRNTAMEIIRIGTNLMEVQDKCRELDVSFPAWVSYHFSWSVSHAYKMINVAKQFDQSVVNKFDSTALYLLASPSMSDNAKQIALMRAQGGEHITHAKAKEIIRSLRSERLDKSDMREYQKNRRQLEIEWDTVKERDEIKSDRDGKPLNDQKAELWEHFCKLVETNDMVHISRMEDDGEDDMPRGKGRRESDFGKSEAAKPLIITTWKDGSCKTNISVYGLGGLILKAILGENNNELTRYCPGCEDTLALDKFGRKRKGKQLKASMCRQCESKRVDSYKKKPTLFSEQQTQESEPPSQN